MMFNKVQKVFCYFLSVLLIVFACHPPQSIKAQYPVQRNLLEYNITTQDIVREAKAREDLLPVRSQACRSIFFLQPQPTKKVFVFFHGFTACPYQFIPLGKALAQAGYNVLIPLMPGHGRAGNWNSKRPPPLPTKPKLYQKNGLAWLNKAQSLGEEVIVGGLSGGGTLAAWLALERPQQIDRALLFAPYLSNRNVLIDIFMRRSKSYFEWSIEPGTEQLGYSGFSLPALQVFRSMGKDILKRVRKYPTAPMFIISSESDRAVGNREHQALFQAVLKRQPKTWYYRFDRILNIPHTMLTEAEGNNYYQLLIMMVKVYVESNLTWTQVKELAYQMSQGKTFNTAVAKLNLSQQVTQDVAAFITMVDKRAIVESHNPSFRGE